VKKHGTTGAAIKEANKTKKYIGQTLIIPILIQGQSSTSKQPSIQKQTTYKVVAGDSLSVIAKKI